MSEIKNECQQSAILGKEACYSVCVCVCVCVCDGEKFKQQN